MVGYEESVKSLWTGTCSVTTRTNTTNAATGRCTVSESEIYTNQACRISFDTLSTTEVKDGASAIMQRITLYIDRSVIIPPSSKITVTQNGVTGVYEMSGKPAVYSVHQEIPLAIFKEWA